MALFYLLTIYAAVRVARAAATAMDGRDRGVRAGIVQIDGLRADGRGVDLVFAFGSLREAGAPRKGFILVWRRLAVLAILMASSSCIGRGFRHHARVAVVVHPQSSVAITEYLRLALWLGGLVLYYGWATPQAEQTLRRRRHQPLVAGAIWL
jgi:hypothetical protein